MSRNRVAFNLPGFPGFVNLSVSVFALALIAGNYWVSIGRLAGVA
ncbi:MAG: hypothetical protein ABL957_00625 [Parvularculaceae bacterium]